MKGKTQTHANTTGAWQTTQESRPIPIQTRHKITSKIPEAQLARHTKHKVASEIQKGTLAKIPKKFPFEIMLFD